MSVGWNLDKSTTFLLPKYDKLSEYTDSAHIEVEDLSSTYKNGSHVYDRYGPDTRQLHPFCTVYRRTRTSLTEWSLFATTPFQASCQVEGRKEMFYLMTHSTHFIYGYMVSDIWYRATQIVRDETCCRHMGYSFRLTARVLLYAPSHRQDNTYHNLYYTSHRALAGTRNSSLGPPQEGSIRQPIAPWANALTTELHLAPAK